MLFSLTTRIYFGHILLLDLPAPTVFGVFRASGRFFWPVSYLLLVAGVAIVAKRVPRAYAFGFLLLAGALQFADAGTMRGEVHDVFRVRHPWAIDVERLRPLLAAHRTLDIWPTDGCGANDSNIFMHLLLAASETAIPVNTMHQSSHLTGITCDPADSLRALAPGELRIFQPEVPPVAVSDSMHTLMAGPAQNFQPQVPVFAIASMKDRSQNCRTIGAVVACSLALKVRDDLPIPQLPPVSLGQEFRTASSGGEGTQFLGPGWSQPEPWGVWSDGASATLLMGLKESEKPLLLTVRARGFPAPSQHVVVRANGAEIAVWDVTAGIDQEWKALIPPAATAGQQLSIEFDIADPKSPQELGMSSDQRKLGLGLEAFRLDPQ